jgi:methionine sulfoxide reductase catalytic subunit
MLVHFPKSWEIPERKASSEAIYRSRRQFMRTSTLAAAGLAGVSAADLWAPALAQQQPGFAAPRNPTYRVEGRAVTPESITGRYNNFYEFGLEKERVAERAAGFVTRPWEIEIRGLVKKPIRIDVDDLLRKFPLEERVYRMRCVEAWSIVVPWVGFPLGKFVEWCDPSSRARYLRLVTFFRPEQAPGQREMGHYPWPYFEGLRLNEAMNELAMLVVGSYGKTLPKQNGSPLRLILPWKYGYKSIKSITVFEFTRSQPATFWNTAAPDEYDFLSNVNPRVPHPRWSQATEQDVATGQRIPTLPYNGYAEQVSHLYS